MTIFVLPKEAEHFFPKQSSISLGFLELLGAVSLPEWTGCWTGISRWALEFVWRRFLSASQGFLTSGIVLELI